MVLSVDGASTLGALRRQILGCQDDAASVTFAGKCLDDSETVESSGLCDGSTLHIVPLLAGGGDGTPAMGKRHKKSHGLCIRCGKRAFHLQKKRCASCGYPQPKMRRYNWSKKAKRRRTRGTGHMPYMKNLARRFKKGFREGGTPPSGKKAKAAAAES